MSVESNPGLHWFCFTLFCDCVIGLIDWSQPIRCQTKTSRDLVTRVFPRLRPFTCIYFEFSLVPCDINLCSDWPLLLWFGFTALNRKALHSPKVALLQYFYYVSCCLLIMRDLRMGFITQKTQQLYSCHETAILQNYNTKKCFYFFLKYNIDQCPLW